MLLLAFIDHESWLWSWLYVRTRCTIYLEDGDWDDHVLTRSLLVVFREAVMLMNRMACALQEQLCCQCRHGSIDDAQIDAHSNFLPGWDTVLVGQYQKLRACSSKPVIVPASH